MDCGLGYLLPLSLRRFIPVVPYTNFKVLLTEHHGTILVNHQLDEQIIYFLIILQSSTCFEQYYAHPQEVELYKHSIWCGHFL
jgi:hypothetical protein